MKYLNKQTVIAAVGGFVLGLFWYQLTAWIAGLV